MPIRYLVTAALPYANGPLHIGHLAGAYLPADIYVRYLRLKGEEVVFVCGSDEHGVAITLGARKAGKSPREFVEYYHHLIQKTFQDFGISFDIYSRTSTPHHAQTVQEFFKTIYEKNGFIEEISEQYYDEQEQMFLADRYIMGTCPVCGYDSAYGDQCEKCGSSLNPRQLLHPRSTLSGHAPVLKPTKHWFFPLNKYESWLREWLLEGHKHDWKANVYGQCRSWIEQGLQPRAITRDLDWGVPVPLQEAVGKVLYVWFDAPIGYITATKELRPHDWQKYWKDPDTRLIHFIGKDNIVFHCIIFPCMLKAEGTYILPHNVPANEFLNLEGEKISTSRNHAVWLHEYLQDFPGKKDELRYVLTAIAPETKDADFTWKDYQARVNNELVAILGNLVNRVMILTEKYFDRRVPEWTGSRDIIYYLTQQATSIGQAVEAFRFREALGEVMNVARLGNQLLSEKEPWKLIQTNKEAAGNVLYECLQIIAHLGIMLRPFLPDTSNKIFRMMRLNAAEFSWHDIGRPDIIPSGHLIGQAELLFQKVEDELIHQQISRLHQSTERGKQEKVASSSTTYDRTGRYTDKPLIHFDDFAKLDLRIGKIIAAEKVEKADKLLKLTVDLGSEQRIIVSGIATQFMPEELIGKQVTVVANLAPRKIRGIESKGMILMAENSAGQLRFVSPDTEFETGARVS